MTKASHHPSDLVADVAIVGGGMVGMTLAAALGSAGLSVAIVDAEAPAAMTAAAFDGRSSAIAFGSQQVLAGIGAWAAMAAEAQPILDSRVSDGTATGGVICGSPTENSKGCPGPPDATPCSSEFRRVNG